MVGLELKPLASLLQHITISRVYRLDQNTDLVLLILRKFGSSGFGRDLVTSSTSREYHGPNGASGCRPVLRLAKECKDQMLDI